MFFSSQQSHAQYYCKMNVRLKEITNNNYKNNDKNKQNMINQFYVLVNKEVLRDLLKLSIAPACLTEKGKLFHNIGAAISNAQSPIVFFVLSVLLAKRIPLLLRRRS